MASTPENPFASPQEAASHDNNQVSLPRGRSHWRVSWRVIVSCTVAGTILGALFYTPQMSSPAIGSAAHAWFAVLVGFLGLILSAFLSLAIALFRNDDVG